MKKKLSLIIVLILLLNVLPSGKAFEKLGVIKSVEALSTNTITRDDIKKFDMKISIGDMHTNLITSDGSVKSYGNNDFGQCNTYDNWKDVVKVDSGSYFSLGIRSDGSVAALGDDYSQQLNVGNWENIIDISAGFYHTIGLMANGYVVATGDNRYNVCNVENWKDIVQVEAGFDHSVGLKSDGTVVAIGSNEYGQCNVSSWTDIVQISVGDWHTIGLKKDGTVVATGINVNGETNVAEWNNIIQVSAGGSSSIGLKSDGTVIFTGANGFEELNISNWNNIVQVYAGYGKTIGLKADGSLVEAGNTYDVISNISNLGENKVLTSIETPIIKLGDKFEFVIEDSNYYSVKNKNIDVNGELYEMEQLNALKWTSNYKANKSGINNVKYSGFVDLYGNSYNNIDTFLVMPLQSITVDKATVASGDTITLTANFSERVSSDFTINLLGAVSERDLKMQEVEGSNGTQYKLSYTIPDYNDNLGAIDVIINNVVDGNNTSYSTYTEKNVFTKSLPIEDVNQDGTINITDLSNISSKYNVNSTSSDFESKLDLNKDNIIDLYDLVQVAKLINK